MVLSGLTFPRVFLRAALVLSCLLPLSILPAQTDNLAGTMPEHVLPELDAILKTALQQSHQAISAAIEIDRAEAARIQADSARWPSLGANLNLANNQEAVSGNTSTQSRASGLFYNIGLGQSLFHWGALKNQSAIGRIGVLIAEKNFAEAYRSLSVLLRQTYLDLMIKKARLQHGRYMFERAQSDLATLKADPTRVSIAFISGRELDLREAKLELDRSEVEFAAGLRRFARLAGLDGGVLTEEKIADDLPRPTYTPAAASAITARVLRERGAGSYEPQILALRVREAEHRYDIEKVRLLPKFNAGAGYSLDNSSTVGTDRVEQQAITRQNVNITAQWNLFDGFATRAAKMEARSAQRLYQRRLSVAVEALLEQVQALERSLRLDAEHLDISDARYAIAVEGKKRTTEESALGQVAKADIERAEGNILISRANVFTARAKFFADWSEFVSIAGVDPVLQNLPNRHVREKR
ncbi:MAG: TolC family protein [Opitutaceae bacterium]|nr:TolC family protein [Opitutaceae bacterium]